jgi:hypothetical protein
LFDASLLAMAMIAAVDDADGLVMILAGSPFYSTVTFRRKK